MGGESKTKVDFIEKLGADFSEQDVWDRRIKPLLVGLAENVINLCGYGITEMLNNANDHSGSRVVHISVELTDNIVLFGIKDQGVGIFSNICNKLHLEDERHAIFELTKGKVTTDPERHSGEGIFFTSRMCDKFAILSGSLYLAQSQLKDWLLQDPPDGGEAKVKGTYIAMEINRGTTRTMKEVFDRYISGEEDDYGFRKTIVAVRLADQGNVLLSRSQAKRVVGRVDCFKEVLLDFEGIADIGPAFADEIFRVFQKVHPEIKIIATNANESVSKMISKALADAARSASATE